MNSEKRKSAAPRLIDSVSAIEYPMGEPSLPWPADRPANCSIALEAQT
jgi:hypothetical protein